MSKDYYVMLGVTTDSTQTEIKSAYRRLAKEYHPDHRSDGHLLFLGIQEAYSVLGDPGRRREYDFLRESQKKEAKRDPSAFEVVEPLAGDRPTNRKSAASHPFKFESMQQLFDMGLRGREEAGIEVPLTARQARRGGAVRLLLPMGVACPVCRGSGGRVFYPCFDCGGAGVVVHAFPVEVEFPAGLRDGTIMRVPLDQLGLRGNSLCLRFRVSG